MTYLQSGNMMNLDIILAGIKKVFALLFLGTLIYSCHSQEQIIKKDLRELKRLYSFLPDGHWQIVNYSDCPWETFYMCEREYNDTNYYMRFFKLKPSFKYKIDSCVLELDYYRKNYSDNEYIYYIDMGKDTSFFYKSPINHEDSLIFIVGKYYFQWRHGLLDPEGMHYFLENMDSLKTIRGNNLPDLHYHK